MQLHSLPIAEPAAFIGAIAIGLVTYWIGSALQLSHSADLMLANSTTVLASIAIGGQVNLMLLDVLGMIIARPVMAVATPLVLTQMLSG